MCEKLVALGTSIARLCRVLRLHHAWRSARRVWFAFGCHIEFSLKAEDEQCDAKTCYYARDRYLAVSVHRTYSSRKRAELVTVGDRRRAA